ncbi:MAG: S-layer homology domain-containing protein [Marinisporobacter sp.]|jgi:hypothetical protein|nr:S-layer homology domain-containing protein [Marinisporobacter sp.]
MKMKNYIIILLVIMMLAMPITSFAQENTLGSAIGKVVDTGVDTLKDVASKTMDKIIDLFKDIKNHWAKNFITQLVKDKIISGYPDGTFRPDNQIKVCEFTVLVLKANDMEVPKMDGPWYTGAITVAKNNGIIKEGEFSDFERPIRRAEMTAMVIRALGEEKMNGKTFFNDDYKIPSDKKGFVQKAIDLGIIGGYPGNVFKADGTATRAEATVVLTKMKKVKNGEAIEKPQPPVIEEPAKEPPVITSMPQRLYTQPVEPHMLWKGYTDIKKFSARLKEVDSDALVMIQQSKDFIPIYHSFNYKNYDRYKEKCKYYIVGTQGYKDKNGLTTDQSLNLEIGDKVKDQMIKESRFYTKDDLIYLNKNGYYTVRGVMQFRYLSGKNLPSGVQISKWYEQDYEIFWCKPILSKGQCPWNHSDIIYAGEKTIGSPKEIK